MIKFGKLTAAAFAAATILTAQTAAAQIPTVTLKLQDYSPPSGPRYDAIKWWMAEVTKRTGGKITFQEFFGASLVPANEALSAVSSGLADVGMINAGLHPAQLPLHTMGSVPFGAATFKAAGTAWMRLYDEVPEMRAELDRQGVVPLSIQGTPSMQLRLRSPLNDLTDIKGRKIRTFGQSTKAVQSWGAVPVSMPFPDIYEALRLGTIDGAVDYLYTVRNYRLHEVGKHFIIGNFGAFPTQPFVMNKRKWDSLGPEAQKIMMETAAESFEVLVRNFDAADQEGLRLMKEAQNTVTELSAEQRKRWFDTAGARGLWDTWAADMDNKKLPGTKLATRYLELVAR